MKHSGVGVQIATKRQSYILGTHPVSAFPDSVAVHQSSQHTRISPTSRASALRRGGFSVGKFRKFLNACESDLVMAYDERDPDRRDVEDSSVTRLEVKCVRHLVREARSTSSLEDDALAN